MTHQTRCVASRPKSRLIETDPILSHQANRSLFDSPKRTRLADRLAHNARRVLATMLLATGVGAAMTPIAPATAHDHLPDATEATLQDENLPVAQTSEILETATICQPGAVDSPFPSRLSGDAMLGQWLASDETAETACRSTDDSAGDLAVVGVEALARPTAANQWERYCNLQDLLTWRRPASVWISPIGGAEEAASVPAPEITFSVSSAISRGLSDLTCEEPVDICSAPVIAEEFVVAETVATEMAEPDASVASQLPQHDAAAFVDANASVTTISESYLPYDMSPEDVIALRMYPIVGLPSLDLPSARSPISYLRTRRTDRTCPQDEPVRANGDGESVAASPAAPEIQGTPAIEVTELQSEIVRAEAVATAFDMAAASLEQLAMSLRRAGDSLVRQANANAGPNRSLLR